MATRIEALHKELEILVTQVPAFKDSGFSIYDMEDLETKSDSQTYPLAGVMYEGVAPVGNTAVGVAEKAGSALLIEVQFSIIIAVQYNYAGSSDTKVSAFNLLDDLRSKVLGYKGVNARPWRFIGEKPEIPASEDGVVFYSQVWQTTFSVVGNFNNAS